MVDIDVVGSKPAQRVLNLPQDAGAAGITRHFSALPLQPGLGGNNHIRPQPRFGDAERQDVFRARVQHGLHVGTSLVDGSVDETLPWQFAVVALDRCAVGTEFDDVGGHDDGRAHRTCEEEAGRFVRVANAEISERIDDAEVEAWIEKGDVTVRLIHAIVAGCKVSPVLNAWFSAADMTLRVRKAIDLGIAVNTDDGLFVAVMRIENRFPCVTIGVSMSVTTSTPGRSDVTEKGEAIQIMQSPLLAPWVIWADTDELDRIGHEFLISHGAYPSTLGYRGFPKSLCTSLNEVICHGIPDDTVIADGDIVNVDITAFLNGVHGDTNATFLAGDVDEESRLLVERTHEAMMRGIRAVAPGRPLNAVGRVIESYARRFGYGVVRDFTGHGIGRTFHSGLIVPHYDDPNTDVIMQPGMTFTIEPMLTLGTIDYDIWPDGWTAVTKDRKRTAQFEHTILVTDDGHEILTLP